MSYDVQAFSWQWPVLQSFVQHYVSYQELHLLTKDVQGNEFLNLTNNAHYLQAINYWCMVFGAKGRNPIHWQNVVEEHEDLRAKLTKLRPDWRSYWEEITHFRNTFSAHREIDKLMAAPSLGHALEAAFVYDEWIRDIIKPDILDTDKLRLYAESYRSEVQVNMRSLATYVLSL